MGAKNDKHVDLTTSISICKNDFTNWTTFPEFIRIIQEKYYQYNVNIYRQVYWGEMSGRNTPSESVLDIYCLIHSQLGQGTINIKLTKHSHYYSIGQMDQNDIITTIRCNKKYTPSGLIKPA